jgi:cell wall-associated NlpC family hydrolase
MAHDLFSVAAYTRTDCSSFVTLCYKEGGAPDPNRRGYDGYGFTGTLWPRGVKVYTPRIADLVFYGWGRSGWPTHVALYVGNGEVISFGSTPIRKLPIRYRGDYMGCRTYPIL